MHWKNVSNGRMRLWLQWCELWLHFSTYPSLLYLMLLKLRFLSWHFYFIPQRVLQVFLPVSSRWCKDWLSDAKKISNPLSVTDDVLKDPDLIFLMTEGETLDAKSIMSESVAPSRHIESKALCSILKYRLFRTESLESKRRECCPWFKDKGGVDELLADEDFLLWLLLLMVIRLLLLLLLLMLLADWGWESLELVTVIEEDIKGRGGGEGVLPTLFKSLQLMTMTNPFQKWLSLYRISLQ